MGEFLTIEKYYPHSRYRFLKKATICMAVGISLLFLFANWCLRDVRNFAQRSDVRSNYQISYESKLEQR
jgi:hypothetical protein